jgi:hypothetical protein
LRSLSEQRSRAGWIYMGEKSRQRYRTLTEEETKDSIFPRSGLAGLAATEDCIELLESEAVHVALVDEDNGCVALAADVEASGHQMELKGALLQRVEKAIVVGSVAFSTK